MGQVDLHLIYLPHLLSLKEKSFLKERKLVIFGKVSQEKRRKTGRL